MTRRVALVLALLLALAAMLPSTASAAPARCEGLFYGIEATCPFRLGGSNLFLFGAAYGADNPPAQIVVELLKWPASVPGDLLAWCDTEGGVLQACQLSTGAGQLPLNTMLICRIRGIGSAGAFACDSY